MYIYIYICVCVCVCVCVCETSRTSRICRRQALRQDDWGARADPRDPRWRRDMWTGHLSSRFIAEGGSCDDCIQTALGAEYDMHNRVVASAHRPANIIVYISACQAWVSSVTLALSGMIVCVVLHSDRIPDRSYQWQNLWSTIGFHQACSWLMVVFVNDASMHDAA